MSTLTQEAHMLIQQQPEGNVRIIVELLRKLTPQKQTISTRRVLKRTGKANGKITLPIDFDEHFDDLNDEIAQDFSEDLL